MQKKLNSIFRKALNLEELSLDEGLYLFNEVSLSELMICADEIRKKLHPENIASFIVDRNINLSNICVSNCLFCNFCRTNKSDEAYVLSIEEYKTKIDELYQLGGRQILLQGGIHKDFGIEFYVKLFKNLKELYPDLKLHALGPAEIVYIAKLSNLSILNVLKTLVEAGLDSLPGAGAEILSDRVRNILSPLKCTSEEWLDVMREAHNLNITTSATMMFGHLETAEERLKHFIKIREVQNQKTENAKGFISFTLWPLAGDNTRLLKKHPSIQAVSKQEFIRMLALSRIMLPNIKNIQVSWLTMGAEVAQLCLNAGANDMSSIMIEENVVSQAGKNNKLGVEEMRKCIQEAGFVAVERNQEYTYKSKT